MQAPLRLLGLLCVICSCLVISANFACAQSPAPQVNTSQPSHVFTPGELVQRKVLQEPDLDTAVRVPADRIVNVALIGEIALAGQSVHQVTGLIHDRLQPRFLVNPQVSIAVLEPVKQIFTVLGQVQRPDIYRFPEQQTLTCFRSSGLKGGTRM